MSAARRLRLIACAMTLVLIAATSRADAAGEYKTIEQASLRITVDTEWIPGAAPGYVPVRWDITNLGEDRTIEIVGTGSRVSRMARFRQSRPSVRQRLQLRAGDRVRFTMPVPASGDMDNMQFLIREDDRTIQTSFVSANRLGERVNADRGGAERRVRRSRTRLAARGSSRRPVRTSILWPDGRHRAPRVGHHNRATVAAGAGGAED